MDVTSSTFQAYVIQAYHNQYTQHHIYLSCDSFHINNVHTVVWQVPLSLSLLQTWHRLSQYLCSYILNSARRLDSLDFKKAPWQLIRENLSNVDWSLVSKFAKINPSLAHTYFLYKLINIMEQFVPPKEVPSKKRSRQTKERNLIWRKLPILAGSLFSSTFSILNFSL